MRKPTPEEVRRFNAESDGTMRLRDDGTLIADVDEMLRRDGYALTDENRARLTKGLKQAVAKEFPGAKITRRSLSGER